MILVAGVGNIFMRDDAFGTEVARRLKEKTLPPDVRVIDFGIRGLDLLYDLLDDHYELVVIVDAIKRGGKPGTLYVLEPDISDAENWEIELAPHNLDPAQVLKTAQGMGAAVERFRIVGCEPASLDVSEEGIIGLTEAIKGSVDPAIEIVECLIREVVQ